jgi:hypothetical protein
MSASAWSNRARSLEVEAMRWLRYALILEHAEQR